jgi:hypothetical protein
MSKESPLAALELELAKERAVAIGRAGRRVELTLEVLRNAPVANPQERATLEKKAAHAVWLYFVQREACGMRNHAGVIEGYAIPERVLALVGSGEP